MKKDQKPSSPPIAASSTNRKNHKAAPPASGNEPKARASRVPEGSCIESLVLDRISDGVLAFDVAMTPIYVNERAGELLGRKPADLLGRNLWAEYPESLNTPFAEACQSALATQTVTAFDGKFPAQDNWLEGRVYPSQDGLSVIFTEAAPPPSDGTGQGRGEDRYQVMFNSMQEGFILAEVILDENGDPVDYGFLEANASMERFLGKSREELVGHRARDVFEFDEPDLEILHRAGRVALGAEPFFIDDYSELFNRSFRIHIFSPRHGQFASLFSDITGPKRTERALQASEDKFSKAFHLSPSAMALMRASDGIFIDINESMLSLFGLRPEEVIGRGARELGVTISDDDRRSILKKMKENGKLRDHEVSIHHASSRTLHLLLSVELIQIADEPCALISALDITERKLAEEKIRDISRFPGENPSPITRFTPDGELLYANPAAAPLLAFWKKQFGRVIPVYLQELIRSAFEFDANEEFEIQYEGKTILGLLVPIREAGYVNFYGRDISERKQTEQSLYALIHQATAGITRIDLDGRFTFVNEAYCDMLGYSQEELVGKTIWDVTHPDDIARNQRLFEQMVADGEPFQLQKRALRRNGSIVWVNVGTSAMRDSSGSPRSAVAIVVDITRQKSAEEALLDSARRTLYLSALGDLLAPLSDPQQIQSEAAGLLGAQLKASRVAYVHVTPDGTALAEGNYTDDSADMPARFNLSRFVPADLLPRLEAGHTVIVSEAANDRDHGEPLEASQEAAPIHAQIIVPLLKDRKLAAALFVQQSQARQWKSEEILLVEETAQRLCTAVERASAKQELFESEQRLRLASQAARICTWELDTEQQSYQLGENFEEVFGFSRDLLPQSSTDISSMLKVAEDMTAVRQVLADVVGTRSEDVPPLQYRMVNPETEEIIWVEVNAKMVYDHEGKPKRMFGMAQNITGRKQVEEQRRAHEQELQQVINQTPFMLTRCSRDLRYRFVSRAYAEMIGRTPEQLAGRPILEIMGEEGFKTISPFVEQVLQGQRVEYEAEVPYAGAGRPALHAIYVPDYDDHGNVAGWFASIMDLTERNLMMQALRESEQKFSIIYEQLPFAAALSRPTDGVIVDVNRAFEQVFGYNKQEAIGRTSFELGINPEEGSRARILADLQAGHSTRNLELPLVTRSHGQRIFLMNIDLVTIGTERYILQTAQDITERKQMEESLRLSEERFSKAFRTSPDAIIISQVEDGLILEVNESWKALFGYDEAEIIGRSSIELNLFADVKARAKAVEQLKQHGTLRNYELDIRRRSGEIRHTSLSAELIEIKGAACLITILRDVTEQKRSEQALRESRQRLALTYDHTGIGLVESSPDGRFIGANEEYCKLLGYTKEEILALGMQDVTHAADLKKENGLYQQLTAGEIPFYRIEIRYVRKDRSLVWGEVVRSIVFDANGMALYAIGAVFDVSARKQVEAALRESQERYHALVHQATAGIVRKDGTGRLLFVNQAFCDMLGYTAKEMMGRPIWELTHEQDIHENKRLFNSLMVDGIPFQLEKRMIRKDGEILWVSVSVSPVLDAAGRPESAVSVYVDVTERRQAEDALRARTEEIDALMNVSPIALFVAHDPGCTRITGNPAAYSLVEIPENPEHNISKSAPPGERPAYRTFRNGIELDPEELPMQMAARLATEIREEDLELRFEDGSQKYLFAFARPLFDAKGGSRGAIAAMLDITESRRAEEALRQSEERFVRFMQHLPGLAWIKDLDGRYVYANAAAQKVFTSAPEGVIGRTDDEIFPPGLAAQFKSNDAGALLDEKGVQVIETLEHADGVLHSSLVSKFPIPGPDGSQALIGGIALDVTERIEMEEALQVAREKAEQTASRISQLQQITAELSETLTEPQIARILVERGAQTLGAATSSVMLLSEDDQTLSIIYSNMRESIIRPWARFPVSMNAPAADAARLGQPVWLESQQQYRERYPHMADQIGKWGYEAALAIPMIYKERVLGVLTLSFEQSLASSREDLDYVLTLARQGAQALDRAQAEHWLRLDAAIMENVAAGIYLVSASDGTIVHVNPQFNTLFGYEPGEVLGRHVSILNAPTDRSPQEVSEEIITAMRRVGRWQGEVLSIRKDGAPFWCLANISTFEHATHGTVWVAARQDISDLKQAQSRLALLLDVSELMRGFEERARVMSAVAGRVGSYFRVKDSAFHKVDNIHDGAAVLSEYRGDSPSMEGEPAVSRYSRAASDELAAGRTIVIADAKEDPRTQSDDEATCGPDAGACITIPLMRDGRWVACFSVSHETPRAWSSEEVSLIRDVAERTWAATERQRIHAALRDSEERLRVTFNTSTVGFATLTPDERFIEVNDAFCQIVGYPRAELLEMKYQLLTHPSYADDTQQHMAQLMAGEVASFSIEKIYVQRDGTEIWVQNNVSLVRDEKANPHHLILICQDITERRRAEAQLRESEEKLRLFIQHAPAAVAMFDTEMRYVAVSQRWLDDYDLHMPVIGRSHYDIFPEITEEWRETHRRCLAGAVEKAEEDRFQRADGSVDWLKWEVRPWYNSDGNIGGILIFSENISERKRAEDELRRLNLELEERVQKRTAELQSAYEFLRESEATSRVILESMPDAIVITNKDGVIVHCNTQVETLFGYSPKEVVGQPVETLLPERFHGPHTLHRRSYENQKYRRIMGLGRELFGLRKDHTEFPVEVMLSPILDNATWDVMVTVRDNTEQRQAQDALRASEEKLRTVFELLPVGISFLDKDERIVDMNPALANILGVSKQYLMKGLFKSRRYIRPDGTPMPPTEFASTRARTEKKTIYNVETGIIKETNEVTWTSVNAAPVSVADVQTVVVTVNITDRREAEAALKKSRERLKVLSQRLVEVQEEERRALARELHDRVGQNLAALNLNLNILRSQLTDKFRQHLGSRLDDSVNLVKQIIIITRSVMDDLRSNVLDDYGLEAALSEYTEKFTQRYGIPVVSDKPANPIPRLNPGIEMTLLRIAQEALTNVSRHAQATQVTLSVNVDKDAVYMTIKDNGSGILSWQKANQPGSHGLRIVRERAEAFGGTLQVSSAYKKGTEIQVTIPLGSHGEYKIPEEKRS